MNATHPATELTLDRFRELFQGLPAELKGMIYEYTFSAGLTAQYINQDYKSPTVLQIDRATRKMFAKSHFSLTTFKLSSQTILRKWLASLGPEHLGTISTIQFDISDSGEGCTAAKSCKPAPQKNASRNGRTKKPRALQRFAEERNSSSSQMMKAEARLFFLRSYLLRHNVWLKPRVIKVNVRFDRMAWEMWTPDPDLSFKNWKVEQRRWKEEEQFERDLKAGRVLIKARNRGQEYPSTGERQTIRPTRAEG
jgi:hypothetical protein